MQKLKVDMDMGSNLRKLRVQHQYTQDRLVARLGILDVSISRATYSRCETGELNIPIRVLVALRTIYACSYDDFFEGLSL